MNINPISITPNQAMVSDGQNTNTAVVDNNLDSFNQMLQALSSGVPVNSVTALPTPNKSTTWPMTWLEILGQNSNSSDPALDLLEEAPNLVNQSGETAISLTEIMTALQPIVTDSQVATTTLPVNNPSDDDTETSSTVIDEANLALLTLMSGFNPSPVATQSQLPSLSIPAETTANQAAQPASDWIAPLNEGLPVKDQTTLTRPEVIAELKSAKTVTTPVETTIAEPAKMNPTFAQELNEQIATTPVSSDINHPAETTANDTVEQNLKPKVEPAEAKPGPVLSTETLNVQNSTFKVQTVPVETKGQLPDVPALHQIFDRVSLMTQNGQTEVRLHLHPEALGQLSIQLHIVDGDIGVRMVAETAQAQKLIQDHLPQLKAAFTAQGLQLNDMAVAVGNGASSFDLAGHRPNNNWFQQSAHTQAYPAATDKTESTTARPAARAWGNGYAIDYQA